jgi:hypothetical protein
LGAATNQVPNAPIEWVAFWAALVVWAELILFTLAVDFTFLIT